MSDAILHCSSLFRLSSRWCIFLFRCRNRTTISNELTFSGRTGYCRVWPVTPLRQKCKFRTIKGWCNCVNAISWIRPKFPGCDVVNKKRLSVETTRRCCTRVCKPSAEDRSTHGTCHWTHQSDLRGISWLPYVWHWWIYPVRNTGQLLLDSRGDNLCSFIIAKLIAMEFSI